MSTTKEPLKYLWQAIFEDGHTIEQPEDDRYSNHDDSAEWNPSAFRDIQDYEEKSPLEAFVLSPYGDRESYDGYGVNLKNGNFVAHTGLFNLEEVELKDRKLIFFREMHVPMTMADGLGDAVVNRYVFGYEAKDPDGKVIKKVIYVN